MEEAARTQLEARWQSIDVQYSYREWEKMRQEDWQRIISQRLLELGRSIAVDGGLFTYMQSRTVFDRRTIETFKVFAARLCFSCSYFSVCLCLDCLTVQTAE